MLLENKNAVIYGAGGAIGGAVARTTSAPEITDTIAPVAGDDLERSRNEQRL